MRFVFFGTPEFAQIFLEEVIKEGLTPELVVSSRDKSQGRNKETIESPVRKISIEKKIELSQPDKPIEILEHLRKISPDYIVVAAYAKIIPKEILDTAKKFAIGIHPSLLPKLRGASPIQTALMNGETKTGCTIYKLTPGLDDGPILSQETIDISLEDDYRSLENKLASLGAKLFIETISKLERNEIVQKDQNEQDATFTKKFKTDDGNIPLSDIQKAISLKDSEASLCIHNKIRALSKEPVAWTTKNAKRIKLLKSNLKDNYLRLEKIQIEGKQPISPDKNFFLN